jgi:uncharacterized damage-inducible protein DinB
MVVKPLAHKEVALDALQLIAQNLETARNMTLKSLNGLIDDDLWYRPKPDTNPIGFLVWHIARVEDMFAHFAIGQGPQVWEHQGWHQHWGVPREDTGNSYTLEQVNAFPRRPLQDLLDYMAAVRRETQELIKSISSADLDRRPYPDRPERVTGLLLMRAATHEYHHQGQIDYLRGLIKGWGN